MKKYVYITQDMVSHATSELFTAENDATVQRLIKAQIDNIDPANLYAIKDSTVFKLGFLLIDDDSGSFRFYPYDNPVVVCRAGQFACPDQVKEVISNEMA